MNNLAKRLFVVIGSLAILGGCSDISPYRYWNHYSMVQPNVSATKRFRDELIDVRFWLDAKRIHFELSNNSDELIKLDWSKASYTHIDGGQHAVSDASSIFTKHRLDPEPTTVLAGETIRDYVVPARNVKNLEEWSWYVYPLFDLKTKRAFDNKGKTFGVDLPVHAGDKTKTYAFRFKIANVTSYTHRLE